MSSFGKPRSISGELRELPLEILQLADDRKEMIFEYSSFNRNVCTSYRDIKLSADTGAYAVKCLALVKSRTVLELWLGASNGNSSDCLELGIRMFTGCGPPKDAEAAMDWWMRIADPSHPGYLRSTPRPIQAKALSCLANLYRERSDISEETLQIDDLFRAGLLANACALRGLVSPCVLSLAAKIDRLGFRRQSDCTFVGYDVTRFSELDSLWEVYDAREAEIEAEELKREGKISNNPKSYICAAEGCGIQAVYKSALLKCSGTCRPSAKPSYCSKECQRAHWKTHKAICKRETAKTEVPQASPTSTALPEPDEDLSTDGRRRVVILPSDKPDGFIKLSSTTMSPAFMKKMRDQAERDTEYSF